MQEHNNSVIVVVEKKDYPIFRTLVEKYKNIMEIVKEYDLSNGYINVQLFILYDTKDPKNYLLFVLSSFPVIAARQGGSSFICVPLQLAFKNFLTDVYQIKENLPYYFFDMLTIEERYDLVTQILNVPSSELDLRLLYYHNNSYYTLKFDPNCEFLFTPETELKLEDVTTGDIRELDLIDEVEKYKFNLAFLCPKS